MPFRKILHESPEIQHGLQILTHVIMEAWVWRDGKLRTQVSRDNPSDWRNVPTMAALADFVKSQI